MAGRRAYEAPLPVPTSGDAGLPARSSPSPAGSVWTEGGGLSPVLAQRQVALAGIALLAVLVALAIGPRGSTESATAVPRPVAEAAAEWYRALAAPGGGPYGRRSACGVIIRPTTLGVAHPVLPCGAKIFLSFEGREVLTQIVDHAPQSPGLEFQVTAPLAKKLGLQGVQPVRWSFARA
jgi:hypothetical protein